MPPVRPPVLPKRASALRRVPEIGTVRYAETAGLEGAVCLFEMSAEAGPIIVESVTGRAMTLAPGDFLLGTPGNRESTRWVVGAVPAGGLVPGESYWVLAEAGIVGALIGDGTLEKKHLARVKYHGALVDEAMAPLTLARYAVPAPDAAKDRGAPVFLVLGTSAEVGKTTAGLSLVRALRQKGNAQVTALKATGTSSVTEIWRYLDFGAAQAFDCVDFGLPTTYPSGREGIAATFERALDTVLSLEGDAVLIECGGDILGANVPVFLDCLKRRRSTLKVLLAAADALGALGGKRVLAEMGFSVDLVTGPCTDTPTLQERTQKLCGVPAINMARGDGQGII